MLFPVEFYTNDNFTVHTEKKIYYNLNYRTQVVLQLCE